MKFWSHLPTRTTTRPNANAERAIAYINTFTQRPKELPNIGETVPRHYTGWPKNDPYIGVDFEFGITSSN